MGILFSCENDLKMVSSVTATDETPDEIVNNLHTLYTDSGVVIYEIKAVRMEKYDEPKNITIFKKGFEVNFYKSKDSIVSRLTADYGEIKGKENLIIARNNVIFTNFDKDQTLKTEELFWDRKSKRVKTDKRFEVIGAKNSAWGYGLDTDETFSSYNMHNVSFTYLTNDTINDEFSKDK